MRALLPYRPPCIRALPCDPYSRYYDDFLSAPLSFLCSCQSAPRSPEIPLQIPTQASFTVVAEVVIGTSPMFVTHHLCHIAACLLRRPEPRCTRIAACLSLQDGQAAHTDCRLLYLAPAGHRRTPHVRQQPHQLTTIVFSPTTTP